jgi:hypothetical protein
MSDCASKEQISSLDDLFKAERKKPFFYKLSLQDVNNNYKDIFESMRKIYMKGLIIHYGNEETNSINIEELTPEKIDNINHYMLSIGIKTNYKVYTPLTIDGLYRSFIRDIENLAQLDISIVSSWKTQLIQSIKLNVTNNNKDTLKNIMEILSNHTAANYFLKMQPPKKLEDYAILVNTGGGDIHVINFEFAKVGDYSKPYCAEQHRDIFKYHRE